MRTEINVVTETDRIVFGYWDEEGDTFVSMSNPSTEEKAAIAEMFGCTPLLVDALIMFAADINQAVGEDLKDIWKKLRR